MGWGFQGNRGGMEGIAPRTAFISCPEVKESPADGEVSAMNDSDDIVKEFLVENYENLDRLDRDLITLEKNPNNREVLGSIFRTIHTIKGTSGILGIRQTGSSGPCWRKPARAAP